eukprot:351853-Chlamydomonas_euryale.AAC.11
MAGAASWTAPAPAATLLVAGLCGNAAHTVWSADTSAKLTRRFSLYIVRSRRVAACISRCANVPDGVAVLHRLRHRAHMRQNRQVPSQCGLKLRGRPMGANPRCC